MEKIKFFNKYKFELFSSIIFLIFTILHYKLNSYGSYSDNWGPDQESIERVAKYLISGTPLDNVIWKHGIGYSLLISPFLLFPNPFNAAGFLFFTTTLSIILKNLWNSFRNKSLVIILIFICISFLISPDMKYWIIGGSNSLSAALILLSIVWSISLNVPKYLPIILGILSGFVFSARYIDYILLSPLYFSSILNFSRIHKKNFVKSIFSVFWVSSIFIVLTLLFHKLFLGGFFITPYNSHIIDSARLANIDKTDGIINQFSNRFISWTIPNLYSTLIDYKSFASELTVKGSKTALKIAPILIFAPYSLVNFVTHLFKTNKSEFFKKVKITTFCASISLIIWLVFYASRWASTAHDLYWYSLRFYMGWLTLIIFLTLYGLILKPKFKTFFISSLIYVILFGYPSIFQKGHFENSQIISQIEIFENFNAKSSKSIYNLPIPFDNGKKSILVATKNGIIVGVDNYSSNLFLAQCGFKDFNIDSFKDNFSECNYFESKNKYEPENGMEFLDIKPRLNSYDIDYKIMEDAILKNKKLTLITSFMEIDKKGFNNLLLDKNLRYKVKNDFNKEFFVRRNNQYYLWNSENLYFPKWPLKAAEKINSINQILTVNQNDKNYCIWELDRNWNYKKDRLCAQFSDNILNQNEEEFQIDINNDGYINKSKLDDNDPEPLESINPESEFSFVVNPIKLEKNILRFSPDLSKLKGKDLNLNIKLKYTGNAVLNTFPKRISLKCGPNIKSCEAFKIGRLNNLWKIWIQSKNYFDYIDIVILENGREKPLYWPISYILIKGS